LDSKFIQDLLYLTAGLVNQMLEPAVTVSPSSRIAFNGGKREPIIDGHHETRL